MPRLRRSSAGVTRSPGTACAKQSHAVVRIPASRRRRLVGPDLGEDRGRFHFEIRRFGRRLCEVRLPTPGEHDVLNALAAAALAYDNGLSPDEISAGLGSFPGLHRRLELLGQWRGVDVDRRLRTPPDRGDGRVGGGSSHGPRRQGMVRFSAASGVANGTAARSVRGKPAKCRQTVGGRHFSGPRRRSPAGGGDGGRSRPASRRTRRRGLAGPRRSEIVETLETQLAPGDVLVTLGAGDTWKLRPFVIPSSSFEVLRWV